MSRPVRIQSVQTLEERLVRLTLTDGSIREVDLAPLLAGAVFDAVREDDEYFRRVTVDREFGTLTWPNGADICPDVLVKSLRPA